MLYFTVKHVTNKLWCRFHIVYIKRLLVSVCGSVFIGAVMAFLQVRCYRGL